MFSSILSANPALANAVLTVTSPTWSKQFCWLWKVEYICQIISLHVCCGGTWQYAPAELCQNSNSFLVSGRWLIVADVLCAVFSLRALRKLSYNFVLKCFSQTFVYHELDFEIFLCLHVSFLVFDFKILHFYAVFCPFYFVLSLRSCLQTWICVALTNFRNKSI